MGMFPVEFTKSIEENILYTCADWACICTTQLVIQVRVLSQRLSSVQSLETTESIV